MLQQVRTDDLAVVRADHQSYIPPAYRWLARNLKVSSKHFTGRVPWWFYTEKPDLRWVRHTIALGKRMVRLEVEIPAARVFTMPAWAWGVVYTQNYLALSAGEYEDWNRHRIALVPDEDQ